MTTITVTRDAPEFDTACPNCARPCELVSHETVAAGLFHLTLDCHFCRTRFSPIRGSVAPPPDVWPTGEVPS